MSTRSQIRFVEGERTAQVYRHSDGYPEGVLPDLAQVKGLLQSTGTQRDPSYTAANYIFHMKLRGMRLYLDDAPLGGSLSMQDIRQAIESGGYEAFADLSQPHFLLGHGVEDVGDIHGDEEYLYIVDTSNWSVKVSGHGAFPTWDDEPEGEDAFDDAEWQFVGSLDEALDEFEG